MKVSHVVILSIIGMLVTSLSVLVFMSRQQVPTQHATTSNETETPTDEAPMASSSTLNLTVAPPSSIALPASASVPSQVASMPPEIRELIGSAKTQPALHLISTGERCTFFVDAKHVGFGGGLITGAKVGRHVVQCHRPNGEIFMQSIDVVEGRINTVTF